jgi:peptidoglycan hydrolase-like protein with peptidoglycan-binding domain
VPDDAPSTINIERETTGGGRALNAADIREIQTRLQSLGLKPGPVDGVAGPQTTAAIQGYLRSRGQAMPARADRALLERLRQETRGR